MVFYSVLAVHPRTGVATVLLKDAAFHGLHHHSKY